MHFFEYMGLLGNGYYLKFQQHNILIPRRILSEGSGLGIEIQHGIANGGWRYIVSITRYVNFLLR